MRWAPAHCFFVRAPNFTTEKKRYLYAKKHSVYPLPNQEMLRNQGTRTTLDVQIVDLEQGNVAPQPQEEEEETRSAFQWFVLFIKAANEFSVEYTGKTLLEHVIAWRTSRT